LTLPKGYKKKDDPVDYSPVGGKGSGSGNSGGPAYRKALPRKTGKGGAIAALIVIIIIVGIIAAVA
jgi:hypothetical protein